MRILNIWILFSEKIPCMIYRCIYVVFVFVGAVGSLDLIWSISDTMNGLMAIPNLIGIIGLIKVVSTLTKEYFSELPSRERKIKVTK